MSKKIRYGLVSDRDRFDFDDLVFKCVGVFFMLLLPFLAVLIGAAVYLIITDVWSK